MMKMYEDKRIIVIIPGRGGSKGIPRKNIRLLNGKPLISYVINTAINSNLVDDVVVTTDDDEIGFIAEKYGANVVKREGVLASDEVTLDPVIHDCLIKYEKEMNKTYDYVICIQPTSPLLKINTLETAIKKIIQENKDNIISVVNDTHLNWGYNEENHSYYPLYEKRVNRQYLPKSFKETGAIFITKREYVKENSRLGKNITLLEVSPEESIDIDSYLDWWVAEKIMKRKKIIIKTDATNEIGTGHVYRGLNIASRITDHEVIFLLNKNKQLGIDIINNYNYPYITHEGENNTEKEHNNENKDKKEYDKYDNEYNEIIEKINQYNPDIVINDFLNTTKPYMEALKEKNYFIVNFEDMGEGSELADILFDALNEHRIPKDNLYSGYKYYILRDEFLYHKEKEIKKEVNDILISFGGTDPNDLTRKTLKAIEKTDYKENITVILGLGYKDKKGIVDEYKDSKNIKIYENVKNISDYMYQSDLVFTSAGRTMYEVSSLTTPCVCLAQNERELSHLFGNAENGIINLGLGSEISEKELIKQISNIIKDYNLRCEMSKRMSSIDLSNGFKNIYTIIKERYKFN